MRVLHVDSARERRGGQGQVRLPAARLRDREGLEQAVAGRAGSRLLETAGAEGISTLPLPWRAALDPRAVAGLARLVPGRDLVHAHGSHALRAVVLALAASGAATRLVATRREEAPPRSPAPWRRADLVLVGSDAVRDALTAAGIGTARIRVVTPGNDPGATLAAYREVLGSWRRRREHARWMERAARASRALPAGPPPCDTSP